MVAKYIQNPIYKEGGPASRLPYAKDDDGLADKLIAFLTGKLSAADLEAVRKIVDPDDGAPQQGGMASDSVSSLDSFDRRFGTGRIKQSTSY